MNQLPNKSETFSEDLKDILSKMPSWPILWGTTVIFIVMLITILFSFLIRYPEIIEGEVVVTAVNPPVKLSARQGKAIKRIYIENQALAEKDQVLLEFRSTSSLETIQQLERTINTIRRDLDSGQLQASYALSSLIIGNRQSLVSELNEAIRAYHQYETLDEVKKKIALIEQRLTFKKDYIKLLSKLQSSVEERTANERESYQIQQKLYEEQVISKAQFLADKVAFLSKEEQVDQFKKEIIQNELSVHEDVIEKESLLLSDTQRRMELQSNITRVTNLLHSFKEEWYHENTIRAPQSGTVNFLKNFYLDEFVSSGDALFAINTSSAESIAYCYLPVSGYGKVAVGQKTRIKLNNFPYEEFGFLEGTVKDVSQFSNQDLCLTEITLDRGTTTHTNRDLKLTAEAKGRAEIVTKDLRLIERLLFNLRRLRQ